jgi:hypothetical protein
MSLMTSQAPNREYATRPKDGRYASVADLVANAKAQKDRSVERGYNLKDLRIVPQRETPAGTPNGQLLLSSPKGVATFSHWAFGQFCRLASAPAAYLRELSPSLAADCLNEGIAKTPAGSRTSLLVESTDSGTPRVRSAMTDSYTRVWDASLYAGVADMICSKDDRWMLPPTWSGETAGAYRGDRDSFLILVNGGSIVIDPSLRSGSGTFTNPTLRQGPTGTPAGPADGMFRGLLIKNSEVGASSLQIESILLRYICGNHMLWGAVMDRNYRKRHVGTRIVTDSVREIARFAQQNVNQSADRDNAIIKALVDHEVAHTKEAVVDELRALGCTKDQAESAYDTCERLESASPRSFWGLAQGLTRNSQQSAYQDERFTMDQLAAKLLAKGARQYAYAS